MKILFVIAFALLLAFAAAQCNNCPSCQIIDGDCCVVPDQVYEDNGVTRCCTEEEGMVTDDRTYCCTTEDGAWQDNTGNYHCCPGAPTTTDGSRCCYAEETYQNNGEAACCSEDEGMVTDDGTYCCTTEDGAWQDNTGNYYCCPGAPITTDGSRCCYAEETYQNNGEAACCSEDEGMVTDDGTRCCGYNDGAWQSTSTGNYYCCPGGAPLPNDGQGCCPEDKLYPDSGRYACCDGYVVAGRCWPYESVLASPACLFSNASVNQLVSSAPNPSGQAIARMQVDGNFVIYNSATGAQFTYTWYSWLEPQAQPVGVQGAPYSLCMQNDGNLVIYNNANQYLWHTFTYVGLGQYYLTFDGNAAGGPKLYVYNAAGTLLASRQ